MKKRVISKEENCLSKGLNWFPEQIDLRSHFTLNFPDFKAVAICFTLAYKLIKIIFSVSSCIRNSAIPGYKQRIDG